MPDYLIERRLEEQAYTDTSLRLSKLEAKLLNRDFGPNLEKTPEAAATRDIFKFLINTLSRSSRLCLEHKKEDYRLTAETFCNMLSVLELVENNPQLLQRDVNAEENYKLNYGDEEVHIFTARNVVLDNFQTADEITFFVRPFDSLGKELGGVTEKVAEARAKFTVKSKREGEASFRIDRQGRGNKTHFVVDLQILDSEGKNKLDRLPQIGAEAGHHFESNLQLKKYKDVTLASIYRAFARFISQTPLK